MTAPQRRLLVINTSRSWGGTECWAVQVAAGLAAQGVRVRFLHASEAVAGPVRRAGLDHRRLLLRADGDLPGLWRLGREIARLAPQAVLATRWREFWLGGLAVRLAASPRPRFVIGLGQRLVPRQDVKRRLIFGLADHVVVNAPEIRAALLSRPWIDPGRVSVVLNGLNLAAWPPRWEPAARDAGARLRRKLKIPAEAPLLLNVGSLTPLKDQAGLLQGMAALRRQIPGVRLLVLGEGFLRPQLAARLEALGLADAVLMPGFSHEVPAAMAAADLLVLTSTNEGMAWVLLEAAASGLPAVATDVSGTRCAVLDGQSGLVVPPGDPKSLVAALAALLTDRPGREAMGRRARALAAARFTEDRMLAELVPLLFGPGRPRGGRA